jgi:plasmid stabilization system protein ParE
MGVPVILTPQSQDDLREIVSFIARDNPSQAMKFGYALIDKALSLDTFPERGRTVPELQLESVREIIHGSYRIIYELLHDPDAVFVLRFWHAARGAPQIEPK